MVRTPDYGAVEFLLLSRFENQIVTSNLIMVITNKEHLVES